MAARRHLFVAPTPMAFGEVLQGRRVAEALVRAGEHVSFVAPIEVHGALAGSPVRRGALQLLATTMLDDVIRETAIAGRFDSVCLVDVTVTALAFDRNDLSLARLHDPRYRLVALDVWSLGETDRVLDFGTTSIRLPDSVLAMPRMIPVPFARPEADGGYDAWAPGEPLAPEQRRAVRARVGAGDRDRVVFLATAAWQAPDRQRDAAAVALARALPPLLLERIAMLGATLVHVGPTAWAAPGARYHHFPQLPPAEFGELLAAADTVITPNISATTIATALAAEVPVVVIGSAGNSAPAFAVWPLGLRRLLAPVLAGNPLLACVRQVELFDAAGFAAALEPDPEFVPRVREYRARCRALPGPAERYLAMLDAVTTT